MLPTIAAPPIVTSSHPSWPRLLKSACMSSSLYGTLPSTSFFFVSTRYSKRSGMLLASWHAAPDRVGCECAHSWNWRGDHKSERNRKGFYPLLVEILQLCDCFHRWRSAIDDEGVVLQPHAAHRHDARHAHDR